MEREIILDTETTGLDPIIGHRIIEIGCVELINRIPTGKVYHTYINPEREVPQEAFAIHGISTDFLQDKPKFNEIADDLLTFLGDSKLVIHNAEFDIKF
jgi:DNA polymerase-3 subunit epsilon